MNEQSTAPEESCVCERCRRFDYDEAFSVISSGGWKANGAHSGVLVARLGTRPMQISACEVCRLIWNSTFWPDKAKREPPPSTTWELRAYSVEATSLLPHYEEPESVREKGFCLTVIPEDHVVLADNDEFRMFLDEKGYIVCSRSLQINESEKRKLRPIPRTYSFERVKGWMHLCRAVHGTHCNESIPLADFRLIDCAALVVVDAITSMSWIALSYVWSIAQDSHLNPKTYGNGVPECRKLPDRIPGVILDTIEVAKSLGYGHIWVDRYCIDQNDAEHVRDQASKMDRIYRGADLTIIAATQQNGLPGVGTTPKTPQNIVRLSDDLTLFVAPSIMRGKLTSLWSSRGWIYQEEMLSRKRLYFTDHEMLFECNGSSGCCESINEPLADKVIKTFNPSPERDGMSLEGCMDWTLYLYYCQVLSFKRRYLTYESDTLDAFRGVMNTFIPGHSFDWVVDARKVALYPFYGIASITSKKSNFSSLEQKVLVLGLTWYHHSTKNGEVRRKTSFPSWSWTGWESLIVIRRGLGYFDEYSTVIRLTEPSVPALETKPSGRPLNLPAIGVLATIIPAGMLTFNINSWRDIRLQGFTHLHRENEAESLKQTPQEFIALLESGKLMCVLLGGEKRLTSGGSYLKLHVMPVIRVDGSLSNGNNVPVTQRIGMLMIRLDMGDDEESTETFELSSILDLDRLPKREILLL